MLVLLLLLGTASAQTFYPPPGDGGVVWLVPDGPTLQLSSQRVAVPVHIKAWPTSHPAQPLKRYTPYHPVARFRGLGVETRPVVYPLELYVAPPLSEIEPLKKTLTAAELIELLGGLLDEWGQRAKLNSAIRFGISR